MVATIKIEGKDYNLPLSYKDITLAKFKEINGFIDADEVTTPFIMGESKEEPTEEQMISYQVIFLSIVTDIPTELLMRVNRFADEENIGIEDIFNSLSWLFLHPKENEEPVKKIGNYHFFDASGIMKDNSLVEYTEVNAINTALNNVEKDYKHINNLMAIFYRPKVGFFKRDLEAYNVDSVLERAKYFDKVDMATIYNALFFFLQSKKSFLKNTEESLAKELEKAVKPSKDIIGSFLSMILLSQVYLHNQWKRLMNR